MGGGHTTSATILYPGVFNYICPLSCGIRESEELDNQLLGIKKAGYKLYWIGVGKEDNMAYQGSLVLDKHLTDLGMPHTLYVSDDAHVWKNWRLYLNTFAQLLFK
jgi:enterochelin esterase family protein